MNAPKVHEYPCMPYSKYSVTNKTIHMPTILIVLITSLLNVAAINENFEGKITYQVHYHSRIPNVSSDQLTAMMGTEQAFYYKAGNYKSAVNGTTMEYMLFIADSSKMYMKMVNMDLLMWTDATKNSDEILNTQLNKNVDTILGFVCDELIIKSKNSTQKYYFNSYFKIYPTESTNHKASNWFAYLSAAKALPLKMIIETEQFICESVATQYKKESITSNIVKIDPSLKIVQSPQ